MLSYVALFLSVVVGIGSVISAVLQRARLKAEFQFLCCSVESHSESSEGPIFQPTDEELVSILDDVFQEEERGLSVLGLNELTGRAALNRSRATTLAKGMARIPFLAGGAGALFVFAFGGLSRPALLQAGACLAIGFLTSLSAQAYARQARRFARKYSDVVETLTREIERRWKHHEVQPVGETS